MGSAEYWSKGSRVEVTSKEQGFEGAWFDAVVVEPPLYHKSKFKKKRLTLIEYTTLLAEDGRSPLREYCDVTFIRPLPPGEGEVEEVAMEEKLVVDTYDRDGWWTGVIARITKQGKYLVAFEDPPHVLEFSRDRLRLHRDFLKGEWSLPPKFPGFSDHLNELIALSREDTEVWVTTPMPCSTKQSTPNEMSPSSTVGSCEKAETEQRHSSKGSLRFLPPKKKLKTLDEPRSEKKCTSSSKDTGRSQQVKRRRLVKFYAGTENASRTGNKERADDASSTANRLGFPVTPVEHSSGKALVAQTPIVAEVFDGSQDASAEMLAAASEKHSVAKVVEDVTVGNITKSGVKGLLLEELHSQILDKSEHSRLGGANQVNEAIEIIQVEEDEDLEDEGQRPALPFVKTSPVWKAVEALEVFQKFPQAPHFLPLSDTKAGCREGLAIAKMVTFANTVQTASKLKITDPKSRFTTCLEDLVELEVHGFDAPVIKSHLTGLLSIKDGLEKLDKKWDEAETQISGLKNEKVKLEEKVEKIIKEMRRFQDELILALAEKEEKDSEITMLRTSVDIMHEAAQSAQHEFQERLYNFPCMSCIVRLPYITVCTERLPYKSDCSCGSDKRKCGHKRSSGPSKYLASEEEWWGGTPPVTLTIFLLICVGNILFFLYSNSTINTYVGLGSVPLLY